MPSCYLLHRQIELTFHFSVRATINSLYIRTSTRDILLWYYYIIICWLIDRLTYIHIDRPYWHVDTPTFCMSVIRLVRQTTDMWTERFICWHIYYFESQKKMPDCQTDIITDQQTVRPSYLQVDWRTYGHIYRHTQNHKSTNSMNHCRPTYPTYTQTHNLP